MWPLHRCLWSLFEGSYQSHATTCSHITGSHVQVNNCIRSSHRVLAMYYVYRYPFCLEYIMEPIVLIRYPVIYHQSCLPLFQPDTVPADFELELRSAIEEVCPSATVRGYYFHLKQELNTKSSNKTSENSSSRLEPVPLFRKRTLVGVEERMISNVI